jgi:hypothetical protein
MFNLNSALEPSARKICVIEAKFAANYVMPREPSAQKLIKGKKLTLNTKRDTKSTDQTQPFRQ